ncbi:PAS domain S-box protein [Halobaculum marinum]|uniref:PAS domain S-box protein n=1 Tax=Halobaculum marinum TaxID=3031996 RepID=UPI0023E39720|nr:PAS domain S-box protein [Halobaculum sp. DT55]
MSTTSPQDLLARALFVAPSGRPREALRRLLPDATRRRLSVSPVGSVGEAVETLAASGDDIDCVICHHEPPLVDGSAAVGAFADAAVPVFAATTLDAAGDALDAGAVDVLPLSDGELVHEVTVNRLDRALDTDAESGGDQTDRERRLVDARDHLRRTLERVSDGFFAITPGWEVTYANSAGAEVLRGIMHVEEGEPLLGENLLAHAPEALESAFYEPFAEAMETQTPVTVEDRYDPVDRWFSVNAYPSESGLSVYFTDVTERKRREQELELKTRALETAPIGMSITDPNQADNPLVYVNERFEEVTGYDAADAVGQNCRFLQGPATDERAVAQLREAVAAHESTTVELRNYTADGDPFWNEVILAPVFDDDGDLRNYTGFQRDVTRRKERERTLGHLVDVTRWFQRVEGREELLASTVDALDDVFGYDRAIVRLHDADEGVLRPAQASERMAPAMASYPAVSDSTGPSGRAFRTGEPVIVDDLDAINDRDYGPARSAMLLPLGDHGTVAVGSPDPESFDREDAALVELLVRTAASAFDRLDRQAEMRRLQQVVDHVDEKAFLLDTDGRFSFATDQLNRYVGVDDLVGVDLGDVVATADAERAAAVAAAVSDDPTDPTRTVETSVDRGDGRRTPVAIELSPVADDVAAGAVAGVLSDISELAETREDLRRERDRFRELFENLPDPVVEVDLSDGAPRIVDANPSFTDVFDTPAASVAGESLNDRIVPSGALDDARRIDRRVVGGDPSPAEVRRTTASGDMDFLFRGIPYTRDGRQHAFAVYTDITEQRERERFLQILNRVLRHNLRNDLNVVMGLGELLAEDLDDPALASAAGVLATKARKATTLSEKAKRIEQVLGARGGTTERVELGWHLRRALDQQRDRFPDAEISVEMPATVPVEVNQDVDVGRALVELAENALEHNDSAEVALHVEVTAPDDPTDQTVIRFSDNGPGIPDTEWAVITGDQEISQLTHASGLGLWLTRWLVDAHNGTLSRVETESDGAVVVLELPTATGESTAR